MAGDWIKMRMDLQRHPKVVRIASALHADKFRVIGGLHAVWSIFDEHSEDGVLEGYTFAAMDDAIGWPGFCPAVEAVGWLVNANGAGLTMPEFEEHNGQSAKRRASESKRKRGERDGADDPQPVRKTSARDADKKRTREEKEKNSPSLRSGEVACPQEIAPELWDDYRAVRTAKKGGVVTATALAGLQREAAKAGVDLETAIRTCCELSWVGFNAGWYAERQAGPRATTGAKGPAGNKYAGAAAAIFGPSPPQQQDFIDV